MVKTVDDVMLNVLIIGCGNIAGGFDAARAADAYPLTHAGAYSKHGKFRLAACVDPDPLKLAAFGQQWGIDQQFSDMRELENRIGEFDVISICSPTGLHADHLGMALTLRPRIVFCEKPLTPALALSRLWVERYAEAGVLLAVNHTRRWAPDVAALAHEIRLGQWGQIRSVVANYNKGILNNGAHMVDLLLRLVGPMSLVHCGAPVWDFWDNDPSVSASLRASDGTTVSLNVTHAADYACFELQIFTEHGVISMEDGGYRWRFRGVGESSRFKGYQTLSAGEWRDGQYELAMSAAIANLYHAVTAQESLACNGQIALEAQALCEQIHGLALEQSAQSNNQRIKEIA